MISTVMKEINPLKYTKSQTDLAGALLRDNKGSEEEKNNALEVLSNWRAAHSYPMHTFKIRLKRVSQKIDKNALSAQRLKRVPSIIKKLNRRYGDNKPTMKLTQMQDIAGCRAVMTNVELAKELHKRYYYNGDLKHKKVNEKDYITYPKKDGYRSIHLIYRFRSDKGRKIYNGLLVEVQIRSKLQHIWATAVEAVGSFTGQAIKSNEGEKDWNDFFRLISSAFAKMEKCPIVPDTPSDEKELYLKIKKMAVELNVISKMEGWRKSLKEIEDLKKNTHFFLLELDTVQEQLLITGYSKRQEAKAIDDYAKAEKKIYGKKEYDACLVGADTMAELRKAYPNYFQDTKEFIVYLKKILNKHSD